jgi:transposase
MLSKGHSYEDIASILKMSPVTISKMNLKIKFEGEGLHPVLEDIFKKQSRKIIVEEIKDVLDIYGKGKNWREVSKRKQIRRRKIKQLKENF